MTRQEELKEGILKLIDANYGARNPSYPELIAFQPMKFLNELLPYLDLVGLVRKVERELPKCPISQEDLERYRGTIDYGLKWCTRSGYKQSQENMFEFGFTSSIEPLI